MAADPRPSETFAPPSAPAGRADTPPADAATRERVLAAAFRAEAPAIYAFIIRRVGSAADAEDLTAEAFLRALRGRKPLDPERVRGLLFTIARAVMAEHWRRLYSEAPAPLDAGALDLAEPDQGQPPDPDGELPAARRVRALLAALPENYRRVLELRFLEGCSVRDTARGMGIRPGNVRVLQLRALRRAATLREILP